jgi:hypothetical protein
LGCSRADDDPALVAGRQVKSILTKMLKKSKTNFVHPVPGKDLSAGRLQGEVACWGSHEHHVQEMVLMLWRLQNITQTIFLTSYG